MEGDPRSTQIRRKHDDLIRRTFYVLLILFLLWVVFSGLIYPGGDIFTFINRVLSGLVTILFLTGILSFYFHRTYGLVNTKQVLKVLMSISVLLSLFTFLIGFVFFRPFLLPLMEVDMLGMDNVFAPLILLLILFLSYVFAFFVLLIQSFGLVSVIVLFQRKYISNVLEDVKKITQVFKGECGYFERGYYLFLRWIFDIPVVLDSSEIEFEKPSIQKRFPWHKFQKAFILETIVALVISIYISLNPLLLQERSLTELFSFASSVSYFIPVIVLPLFIFLKLQIKIPGPAGDFHLFDGIRSRLMSLVLALGTIILFLRLALEAVNFEALLYSFFFYFFGFIVNAIFITFVYFNYFENSLAEDILQNLD